MPKGLVTVLAEQVQTVMRRYGVEYAYDKLKDLARGRRRQESGASIHNAFVFCPALRGAYA